MSQTLGLLSIFAAGVGGGLYAGRAIWGPDPVTKHCRHRYVRGVYGDERNEAEPFVLRCTSCGSLVMGGIEEANWKPEWFG